MGFPLPTPPKVVALAQAEHGDVAATERCRHGKEGGSSTGSALVWTITAVMSPDPFPLPHLHSGAALCLCSQAAHGRELCGVGWLVVEQTAHKIRGKETWWLFSSLVRR